MPRSRQKKSPEEEAEARRRHAEQERLRRAKMTEEQLLEDRARHAARQRRRYADMRYAAIVSVSYAFNTCSSWQAYDKQLIKFVLSVGTPIGGWVGVEWRR